MAPSKKGAKTTAPVAQHDEDDLIQVRDPRRRDATREIAMMTTDGWVGPRRRSIEMRSDVLCLRAANDDASTRARARRDIRAVVARRCRRSVDARGGAGSVDARGGARGADAEDRAQPGRGAGEGRGGTRVGGGAGEGDCARVCIDGEDGGD